jgi:Flp pilus assembly pilin Flp
MLCLLCRFVREESGQDLIEYGLLGCGIATVGILAWDAVRTELGVKYAGWDSGVQDLWEPDDPITP